jgi:hypothetical protein
MRSRKHRWLERVLAWAGLCWVLLSGYIILAFSAALLTVPTDMTAARFAAELLVVLAAFAALAAHRWRPSFARFAHWTMLSAGALVLGTCAEVVELPPHYDSFAHRGIRIEYADTDGVGAEADQIRNVIDQVYARSGLSQPGIEIRMRFMKNTGGRPLQVGDWRDASDGGADIALTTDRGHTRGGSFILEGSFLLAEALARRAEPDVQTGARDGFAYWTMLGVSPQPTWARGYLEGRLITPCSNIDIAGVQLAGPRELTIWLPNAQRALHLDAIPFVDAERSGGIASAQALFDEVSSSDSVRWLELVRQHCSLAG